MNPLPRIATTTLERALEAMPAVIVTGARQTGKSTLVGKLLDQPDRAYYSLDDLDTLLQARDAPGDLVRRAARMTIDEVQRAPDLILALKAEIDRARSRGRFVLTGSANLLLMRRVADSLAGRAYYLTLWPLTRRERLGQGRAGLWGELLALPDADWPDFLESAVSEPEDWRNVARTGGYPVPALHLSPQERELWFAGYISSYVQRDIQDLAAITALPDFRRLMSAAALRIGQLLNQTELGRDVALPQPTVHRYLNLLETSYQLIRLPAYSVNRTKRLIKSPKAYWVDTGLALHLSGSGEPTGAHLENLVLLDLLAWRDTSVERAEVLYWRTASGQEVDFVIETRTALLPIEIKATTHPRAADAAHVQAFRAEYGGRARAGLLLHGGNRIEWISSGVLAVPWWRIL